MKKRALHIALYFGTILSLFIGYSSFRTAYALDSGWSLSVPETVTFSNTNWQVASHTSIVTFPSAVSASNAGSTTQGFTLGVTTTEPTHTIDATLFIPYTNLECKTGAASSSPTQDDGIAAPRNDSYSAFSGSLSTSNATTIMTADARTRSSGAWSVTPTLQLTIPQQQKTGLYNATLTFSLS